MVAKSIALKSTVRAKREPKAAVDERAVQEENFMRVFTRLEEEIKAHRRAAHLIIEQLPVPMSAHNGDQEIWSQPSKALKEKFPNLFGGK